MPINIVIYIYMLQANFIHALNGPQGSASHPSCLGPIHLDAQLQGVCTRCVAQLVTEAGTDQQRTPYRERFLSHSIGTMQNWGVLYEWGMGLFPDHHGDMGSFITVIYYYTM